VALNIPIDKVTISFALWNFAAVGLLSIFWRGPLYVQQFYLVCISAIIAWALTKMNEWTTWVLLALLVLWDLFAVLTPCGPLRVLVESSQRQNVQIPALLYSVTMIYFMADMDPKRSVPAALVDNTEGPDATPLRPQPPPPPTDGDDDDDDDERSGLKLGLGDFVFYSVLVARACMFVFLFLISV